MRIFISIIIFYAPLFSDSDLIFFPDDGIRLDSSGIRKVLIDPAGVYILYYTQGPNSGVATSEDGLNFTIDDPQNYPSFRYNLMPDGSYKHYFIDIDNDTVKQPFHGELHGNWLLVGGDETKQQMDKELSLSMNNVQRLSDMIEYAEKSFKGTIDSFKSNLSKTFLKALREIDGEETKFHFHCLRHTFAVRRYLQTRDIYQVKQEMGHSSVTTTEIYAKFSLRRLEMDFPSLVKSNNSREIREKVHGFEVHKPSANPLNTTLVGS